MKITKDLFYSCLSGEIVGYFILRNNNRIHSECLSLVNYNMIQTTTISEYTFLLSNLTQTMGFLHTAYNEYGQNQFTVFSVMYIFQKELNYEFHR